MKDKICTEHHHEYKIPYPEFWEQLKDNKLVGEDIYYSPMYGGGNRVTITLDIGEIKKHFGIRGDVIYMSYTKKEDKEITITTVEKVDKDC